jgi:hypothetical protein
MADPTIPETGWLVPFSGLLDCPATPAPRATPPQLRGTVLPVVVLRLQRDLLLIAERAAEVAVAAEQPVAAGGVHEELRHLGRGEPVGVRLHDRVAA